MLTAHEVFMNVSTDSAKPQKLGFMLTQLDKIEPHVEAVIERWGERVDLNIRAHGLDAVCLGVFAQAVREYAKEWFEQGGYHLLEREQLVGRVASLMADDLERQVETLSRFLKDGESPLPPADLDFQVMLEIGSHEILQGVHGVESQYRLPVATYLVANDRDIWSRLVIGAIEAAAKAHGRTILLDDAKVIAFAESTIDQQETT